MAYVTQVQVPFPPSANTCWRCVPRRGVLISAKGREYRQDVHDAVSKQPIANISPLQGRLSVTVHLSPPDRRVRDLDNYLKPLLDALTHAGVWCDDSQIDCLTIVRRSVVKNGQALLFITVMCDETKQVSSSAEENVA